MPRRDTPDALALAVGLRIRQLRAETGLTLEKLAYESELGSKGHLSNLERGLAIPNVGTLAMLAARLGVDVLDLLTFPDDGERHALIDLTRSLSVRSLKALRNHAAGMARPSPQLRPPSRDRWQNAAPLAVHDASQPTYQRTAVPYPSKPRVRSKPR